MLQVNKIKGLDNKEIFCYNELSPIARGMGEKISNLSTEPHTREIQGSDKVGWWFSYVRI